MEKQYYLVQSPMPISFDIPALNIVNAHQPVVALLTSQEVQILLNSVPNIKVVLRVENPVQKQLLVEQEVPTVAAEIQSVPSAEVQSEVAEEKIKSTSLNLRDSLAKIESIGSIEELRAFVPADEQRKGIREAFAKRTEELNG